jgi:hypothetical protein
VQTHDFTAPKCAGKPEQQNGLIAQSRQIIGQCLQHLSQQWREDGCFAIRRNPFRSAYTAHGALDLGIFRWQTVAGLLVIVADAAQAAINRRDGVAINKIDHIAKNCLWEGGQGTAFVCITPRAEVFPVRSVGIQGILRVTVGDVGTRSCQEIFDGRR